ncbi:MAG: hypothetical protein ACHP7P_06560 [Terriglobales bacterium]
MALVRKAGILSLALFMLGAPAMACLGPVMAVSMDKCCRPQPISHCGAMPLPTAKSCCSSPATPAQNSLAVRTAADRLNLPVIAQFSQSAAHDVAAQAARFLGVVGGSPPESPPGSLSVLRI